MTKESFQKLEKGDIVQNLGSGNSYVVSESFGDKVVLIRTLIATHPSEWILIQRLEFRQEQ